MKDLRLLKKLADYSEAAQAGRPGTLRLPALLPALRPVLARVPALVLALALLTSMIPAGVFAAEPIDDDMDIELIINLATDEGPIVGAHFSVYHVADVTPSGNTFTLAGDFKDLPVNINALSDDNSSDYAMTLMGYVKDLGIKPVAEATTDEQGRAVPIAEYTRGLYLIEGDEIRVGDNVYDPNPFLMRLPRRMEDDEWVYISVADAKYEFKIDPYNPVTPHPGPSGPDKITFRIRKLWEDELDAHESVKVKLLRDSEPAFTAVLSESNGFETEATVSDTGGFTLVEEGVPEGYTVVVSRDGTVFTVINTKEAEPEVPKDPETPPEPAPEEPKTPDEPEARKDPEPETPPEGPVNAQTGTLSYLPPLIMGLGFVLAAGALIFGRKKDGDEKNS